MYEWHGAGHMGGMWLWWIVGIAIVAAFFWAVARAKTGTASRTGGNDGPSAEELLKRRYANGKIDTSAYEKRWQLRS